MRLEQEKVDEGPELTIVSLSGEVPGPRARRADRHHRPGHLRTGQLFGSRGQLVCYFHMISAGGLLIECSLPVASGEAISVEIRPGHRIAGQVAWTDGTFSGIRFAEWLDVLKILGNETLEGFPARHAEHSPMQPARPRPLHRAVNRIA
ncbi:MAG: hypothetical protein ABS87_09360 [Sphingomonas sp. SCN 67-18]|uniref:PilZ domain-containing protein n=1 Tax=uncultured Sphingomonas sp. TaxID=158754 RepID=UPI00086B9589|nr:PilZ domain-containing protein [Sphingomonas sp. SCN 67-18]ODU20722.1 MAG: hypothetical protein ABS87_09360 [Sphingomonas sp. SCN 67-18]